MSRCLFQSFLLLSSLLHVFGAELCLLTRVKIIQLRNRLFFTAGDFVYADSDVISPYVKLQWLDLDGSFSVDGNIPDNLLQNTTDNFKPGFTGDAFWTDANETTVYPIGQSAEQPPDGQSTLDAYNVANDVWQSVTVSGGPLNKGLSLDTMYASSTGGGEPLSFISGGFESFRNGLVVFNSSNPQNPSWRNVTSDDLPYLRDVQTQYVRYGSKGALIAIGGSIASGDDASIRQFNSIQVYDIAAGKWSTIFATGEIPPTSKAYCSAVSAAPDDSSMHFIIYGGWENQQGDFDDDHAERAGVYILIMPAFHWIKVNTTYADGVSTRTERRMGHNCVAYRDRQILVFGGTYDHTDNPNKTCSDTFSPLRMLDLTTQQWQKEWPLKDTAFQVPQAVIDVVGGGPAGGAKPASTWQQTLGDNVALFSETIPRYDPLHPTQNPADGKNSSTTAENNPAATTTPNPSAPDSSGISHGALAGAVVGGVAGLALIIGALYLLISRSQRRQKAHSKNTQPPWSKPELETTEAAKVPPPVTTRFGFSPREKLVEGGSHQARELDGQSVRARAEAEAPTVLHSSPSPRIQTAPRELGA
ncbi:MAG: hypothetical protein Q9160_004312 [Pyrenula sp. 1 TL-2023]